MGRLSTVIQNDSSRRQRQWTDLTDLKKLTHIQQLVDESIQVHTGKVASIEEFAKKTTQYSQDRSQHPITVEAVKVDGEIRGLRFHLTDDPHHRTSGKYLATHLKCENNYTPSRLARSLGISSQSQQNDGFESDLGTPTTAPKIQQTLPVEEEFTFDILSPNAIDQNTSSLDEEIDDEEWDTVVVPTFTKAQPQTGAEQSEQDDENETEADDFEDFMSGDEPLFAHDSDLANLKEENLSGADRSDSSPAAIDALKQPISEPDPSGHPGYNPYLRHSAEEFADLSGRANTVGSDVNGLNLLGLAGQAIALGSAVAENTSNAIRLNQAERGIQAAYERVQSFVDRHEQIQVQNTQNHVEATAIRVDDLAERVNQIQRPQNSEEVLADLNKSGATSPGMPSIPAEVSAEDERAEVQTTEVLATGAAELTDGVNQLSQRLQADGDPIAPLRFDSGERISKRLSRIEDYLKQINQRLDALETIVQQLEEQVGLPPHAPETHSNSERKDSPITPHETWGMTCGKQILGYGEAVNQAIGNPPDEPGAFDLSKNRIANIERNQDNIQITVEDEQGNELYCANTSGMKWIIEFNNLHSDDDRRLITSLPQTQQDFQSKQAAQNFIAKLEELHPNSFNDRESFSIAPPVQEPLVARYFEEISFEVTEKSGNPVLQGLDKTGEPLLIAQRREQNWDIELCKLSPDAMSAVTQQQDDRPRSAARSSSPQANATERQRKEQLEQ
jgi:hypothetical protein